MVNTKCFIAHDNDPRDPFEPPRAPEVLPPNRIVTVKTRFLLYFRFSGVGDLGPPSDGAVGRPELEWMGAGKIVLFDLGRAL